MDDTDTATPEELLAGLEADMAALVAAGELDLDEAESMRRWLSEG